MNDYEKRIAGRLLCLMIAAAGVYLVIRLFILLTLFPVFYVMLIVGGAYLMIEHIIKWKRWDIEIFGHEWYGLYMILGAIAAFFIRRRGK